MQYFSYETVSVSQHADDAEHTILLSTVRNDGAQCHPGEKSE